MLAIRNAVARAASLVSFVSSRRAVYVLDISQAPDRQANDLNHPEAELVL